MAKRTSTPVQAAETVWDTVTLDDLYQAKGRESRQFVTLGYSTFAKDVDLGLPHRPFASKGVVEGVEEGAPIEGGLLVQDLVALEGNCHEAPEAGCPAVGTRFVSRYRKNTDAMRYLEAPAGFKNAGGCQRRFGAVGACSALPESCA